MGFAKWVYTLAAVWGVLTVPPLYFAERAYAARYGAVAHPEWFYGGIWLILVFQLLYFIIGRDPARYRPMMPVAMLGKLGYATTLWTLCAMGRTPLQVALTASPDLIWTVLFLIAYARTATPA
jgi:hypothetical protein